ncbi:MAG: DNA mismatch repair endonuclease MutL [Kiritimatiellae bacterium]|nr:DNA mismatch repair endonuclease MutL [Kiritimatiellia bacterium]
MRYTVRMGEGMRIRVLNDHVINKIAAGEVVDRPASVVKELVENSFDAGATRISVDVVSGGRSLIRVTDDGSGMSRDDAMLSVERHATSKIREVEDIERIATLGFRGEALAAIAAVSRFTLQTQPRGAEEGTQIQIAGGRVLEAGGGGFPAGTSIAVRQLFFNVPARRKFLRTDATEFAHVRQTVLGYALARPEVGMSLAHDGRTMLDAPAGDDLLGRLGRIHPRAVVESLRRVDHSREGVRVHGYAGVPMASRADRSEQHLFVNGRPASAPLVYHALSEGYQTLLPRGRHPMVFLFIETSPDEVDVNVHPTKKEVRFRRPGAVRDAVIEALRRALMQPESAEDATRAVPDDAPRPPPPNAPQLLIPDLPAISPFAYPRLPAAPPMSVPGNAPSPEDSTPGPDTADAPTAVPEAPRPWTWCRVVGQVGGLFVVMETDEGLVLLDPHAAHERVLFDRWLAQSLAGQVASQGLLAPETHHLSPKDADAVRSVLPELRAMGFGISEFGGDSFLVDALPSVLNLVSSIGLLPEISRSLDEGGSRGGTERWIRDRVATAACRAAVKARDRLTLQEIERLVMDLAVSARPYTCPHGRPTMIHFRFPDLYRKFGRLT